MAQVDSRALDRIEHPGSPLALAPDAPLEAEVLCSHVDGLVRRDSCTLGDLGVSSTIGCNRPQVVENSLDLSHALPDLSV